MIKIEYGETYGWESAIRGMRNPMNSWDKSDSCHTPEGNFAVGKNDFDLMMRLRNGGSDDRKYMRQILVSCNITAPLYWWKEMDQYKVGTATNSCSTMHKIQSKEFTLDDFSTEHLNRNMMARMEEDLKLLNFYRDIYNDWDTLSDQMKKAAFVSERKDAWWQMIQFLPSSYNQKRTWSANYEVLANIYHARRNHKLDDWREFCEWIKTLPYSKIITG